MIHRSILLLIRKTYIGEFLSGIKKIHERFFYNPRKKLGYCDPTATLLKPLIVKGEKNVFLYEDTILGTVGKC